MLQEYLLYKMAIVLMKCFYILHISRNISPEVLPPYSPALLLEAYSKIGRKNNKRNLLAS